MMKNPNSCHRGGPKQPLGRLVWRREPAQISEEGKNGTRALDRDWGQDEV